ncbi:MAG TPA: chemotaxis protein CheD, partial [Candidatus Altiarchaeales archaeon]|nr:chemotaxis protein CheD [Candidatus Altiarchaeales archaeon]
MPEKEIPIETGAGIVTDEPCILESIGIGSSIAICLYDKKEKIAGMAHVMLGKNPGTGVNPWRFADSAIEMLLDMMEEKGAKRSDIRAKIFGGAHIFKTSTLN